MTHSDDDDNPQPGQDHGLLGDMVVSTGQTGKRVRGGELLADSTVGEGSDEFSSKISQALKQTEVEARNLSTVAEIPGDQPTAWTTARVIVEQFRPVPWFIWRLSNFVFGRSGSTAEINEGMVFGMRRLLFAAASDSVLGSGEKINSVRSALRVLSADVVAAASVIHAICRRLHSCQFERIWRPILDDAIVRCQIGLYLGQLEPRFGGGRGMLAGFSGRSGLAVLIATGTLEQARTALEMLAAGLEIRDVGSKIYSCNPLQVSAMLLSAAGCGRDAAFGTVAYASQFPEKIVAGPDQERWLAAYTGAELVRVGKLDEIPEEIWKTLHFTTAQEKDDLQGLVKMLVRQGHRWNWIIGG